MATSVDRSRFDRGHAPSDADVMAQLQALNADALEALVERYGRSIRRVAVGILHDAAEAEDVTQEVFFEVYRRAHLYNPSRGTVRAWLMQYAYHRSLRRKAALKLRVAYRSESLDGVEGKLGEPWPRLTLEERRWFLRAGLAQLPERQRTTLELACLQELSLRDVAAHLRVSLGCARNYYYRGLARLRTWAYTIDRGTAREE